MKLKLFKKLLKILDRFQVNKKLQKSETNICMISYETYLEYKLFSHFFLS